MENNYNIDKHISQSLREFSIKPAISSFKEVMEKLEQKRKRKRFFILLYSGVATIAASLLAFFIFTGPYAIDKTNHLSVNNSVVPNTQPNNKTSGVGHKGAHNASANADRSNLNKQQHAVYEPAHNNSPKQIPRTKNLTDAEVTPNKELTNKPNLKNEQIEKAADENQQQSTAKTTQSKTIENGVSVATASASSPDETITKNIPVDNKDEPFTNTGDGFAQALPPFFLMPVYPASKNTFTNDVAMLPLSPLPFEYAELLVNKNKRFPLMLGFNFDPQLCRFILTENKRRDASFNTGVGKTISEEYLQDKKQMNKPYFSYAIGLKAGTAIHEDWEVWFGIGMQKIKYTEKAYPIPLSSVNTTSYVAPSTLQNYDPVGEVKITYNYSYYGAEVKRNIQLLPFLKTNIGLGVKLNQWYSVRLSMKSNSGNGSYFLNTESFNSLSRWGCSVDLKTGVIYDVGKRWQFRVSPGVFYSPTSVFNKNYAINQKSYGIELETLLIFKI